MEIEFFHNSVCSHCYIQSRRLQKILKEFPEAKVIHRSFPLNVKNNHPKKLVTVSEREDTISKWKRANRVDEEKRFNVEALEAGDDLSNQHHTLLKEQSRQQVKSVMRQRNGNSLTQSNKLTLKT